ncbi:MAG TPA: hypothetical protein VF731_12265 [Solirubrobacterales bacterium]
MALNPRLLGPVLAAAIAIAAVAAPGAAAEVQHSFTSEVEPTELTGSGGVHEWKLGSATMKCAHVGLTGVLPNKTSDQMSLTPEFKECKLSGAFGSAPVTVTNTGCKTTFDSDTTPDPNTTKKEDAVVSLDCGHANVLSFAAVIEGEGVYFHFFDTHPEGVPVNQELHGASYEVIGEGLSGFGLSISMHVFGLQFLCTGARCEEFGLVEGTNKGGTTIGGYQVFGYADAKHEQKVNLGLSSP